jgi:hypothetical protein
MYEEVDFYVRHLAGGD